MLWKEKCHLVQDAYSYNFGQNESEIFCLFTGQEVLSFKAGLRYSSNI